MSGRLLLAVTALLAAGCGSTPPATDAPLVLTGDVRGQYHSGAPSECGPGDTTVTGYIGNEPTDSSADLTVSDSGKVVLTVQDTGSYSGKGAVFRPGVGWDLQATLHLGLNRTVRIAGHLPC